MPHHPRLVVAALAFVAPALLGAAAFAAAPATGSTSTIYQQRSADGRIVLTDRPSPLDLTERSWQSEREDPVAARQRADALARRTEEVSLQVQRSIDRERAARESLDADAKARAREAQAERDAAQARADDGGGLLLAPYRAIRPFGFAHRPGYRHDDRPGSRPDRRGRVDTRPPARAGRPAASLRPDAPDPTGRR